MLYQFSLSPQVKRWAIVTYKHGIYELLHELPNDLRLRILAPMSRRAPLSHAQLWPPPALIAARGALPTQEKKDLGSQETKKY